MRWCPPPPSSSFKQAVNAHFGVHLYGRATHHDALADQGEAMLLMESHSSKYYWCAIPSAL